MDGDSAGNPSAGNHSAGNNPQPLFEPGKIHVDGLSRKTTLDDLVQYFSMFGEIKQRRLMMDHITGQPRSRRFGFITFADPAVVDRVLSYTHVIDGKQVTVQRAIGKRSVGLQEDFRTNTISVTGIPSTVTEDEFRDFFGLFGEVRGIEIIRYRFITHLLAFGLITYDSEETVEDLLAMGNKIDFAGVQVEIKTNPTIQNPPPPVLSSHSNGLHSSHGGGYDANDGFGGNHDIVRYWPSGAYGTDAGAMGAYRGDPSLGHGGAMGAHRGDPSLGHAGAMGAYRGDPSLGHAGAMGSYRGDPLLGHAGAMGAYRGDPSRQYAGAMGAYIGDPSLGHAGAMGSYRGDPLLGHAGAMGAYIGDPSRRYAGAMGAYIGDPSCQYAGAMGAYRGDPLLGHAGAMGAYRGDPSHRYAAGYDGVFGRGYVLGDSSGTSESYGAHQGISPGANQSSYNASLGSGYRGASGGSFSSTRGGFGGAATGQ